MVQVAGRNSTPVISAGTAAPPEQARHTTRSPTSRSRSVPASQRKHIIHIPQRQKAKNSSPNPSPAQGQRDKRSANDEGNPPAPEAQIPIWPFQSAEQGAAPVLSSDAAGGGMPAGTQERQRNQPPVPEAAPEAEPPKQNLPPHQHRCVFTI